MTTTSTGGQRLRLDVKPDGIAHVLRDRLLSVPLYQRSFLWQKDQLTDYWSDLAQAQRVENTEYFLGTVVVTPDPSTGRLLVIDGQQRLATTTMLLAAIRNAYLRGAVPTRAGTVETRYIASRDLDTDELQPRLHLNSEDDNFFRAHVVLDTPPQPPPPAAYLSNQRIIQALTFLSERVDKTIQDAGANWQQALANWVTFLEQRVLIVLVEVPDETHAFTIFETLNDRGLDLTIADLLKNYLFSQASSRLDEVKSSWISSVSTLELSAENSVFVSFLRHYWSSIYGLVREKDLYKSFKERIRSPQQAVDFAQQLQAASRLYAALLSSDHSYWAELGTETKTHIRTLLRLGLEQNRPLLLAAMQHLSPTELKALLRAMVSLSVRALVVGGVAGSGTIERAMPDAAVKIRSGTIKTTEGVLQELSGIIPSDTDFEEAFKRFRVSGANLARYYLLALERAMRAEVEPELVPNEDEERVNLEHILPRNPKLSDWPHFTHEDANQWIQRLGNLVLLQKTKNERLGNKPYTDKQPVIGASELKTTQLAAGEADWSSAAIQRRQEALARLAPQVWPRQ